MKKILMTLLLCFISLTLHAEDKNRFYYSGDGKLKLKNQKTGYAGTFTFRNPDGSYNEQGLQQVHKAFNAPYQNKDERLSLRFIEFLDYLQEKFHEGQLSIRSGYRSPVSNQNLRNQGKLAATSSMHIEAAAGDMILIGTASKIIFEYVRDLNCCGIGWYGSAHFHIDTGPARWWGRTTSKTEDKEPQLNEKIILQSDYDYYAAGELIPLKFMRVTNYPIDLNPQMILTRLDQDKAEITPLNWLDPLEETNQCKTISDRKSARQIKVMLPKKLKKGDYALKVSFCNKRNYTKMPDEILSRKFTIR